MWAWFSSVNGSILAAPEFCYSGVRGNASGRAGGLVSDAGWRLRSVAAVESDRPNLHIQSRNHHGGWLCPQHRGPSHRKGPVLRHDRYRASLPLGRLSADRKSVVEGKSAEV